MDVSTFLLDPTNNNCTTTAYCWDQEKTATSHNFVNYVGGYGTFVHSTPISNGIYTPATYKTYNIDATIDHGSAGMGQAYQRRFAPIVLGFIIVGKTSLVAFNSNTVKNTFWVWYKESLPISDFSKNGIVKKEKNDNGKNADTNTDIYGLIRLKVTMKDLYSREIALALKAVATSVVDKGMDGKSSNTENSMADAYFYLYNTEYAIQSLPFKINKRIKLGVKVR
ncbi:MAG: hypothetical protein ACI9XR_001984 [Flavobacterium sp.]